MNNFKLNIALLEPFLARTKVMIGIILRANSELGTKELEDLQQRYNFPQDFIDGIKSYTLNPTEETREFIREIKGTSKSKLGINDKEKAESIYGKKINQELDLTFFRKSLNDIRTGLEILSQAEHEEIMNYIENENKGNNPFEKEILDGMIEFKRNINGTKEVVSIRNQDFEKEAKKLRNKIGVDKLKKELEELRQTGDKEKVEEKELEITNIILKELENSYHYICYGDDNGYKPVEIQKNKEVQCIGFSIIGHALLSEFSIKQKGLDIPGYSALEISGHSALEIDIGKNRYYFDSSGNFNKVYKIVKEEEKKGSIYKKYTLEGNSDTYYARPLDSEKILLSQVYNNKGSSLFELGEYKEAIKMFDKALNLDDKNQDYYNNKGSSLFELGEYKEAIKIFDKAIELNPKDPDYYNNKGNSLYKLRKLKLSRLYIFIYKSICKNVFFEETYYSKEKTEIKKLITNQDFEGLRLYLLSLEKSYI